MHRVLPRLVIAAGACVLLCGFATPVAAQSKGTSTGSWDLPQGGANGSASGVLLDSTGTPVFTLAATLVQTSTQGATRKGTTNGDLTNTSGLTVWQVTGTWTAKNGSGTFTATIGRRFGNLLLVVGQISGKFDDSGPGVGSYTATWFFNQF